MCIALIYWGTNQPASWLWAGGSILRFDWLVASVVGICCLKQHRPVAAGLLLAWAVGVRIFPIAIVMGMALPVAVLLFQSRRLVLTAAQWRFASAFAGGIVGIVLLSSVSFGPSSWVAFSENSALHMHSDSVNRIGLRPLLSFQFGARLNDENTAGRLKTLDLWEKERWATYESRRPIWVLIAVSYFALLLFAVRGQSDWAAAALGIGIIPVMIELGCYYYGFLLVFACLWPLREEVGVALMLLSIVSCLGAQEPVNETLSAQTSLAILLFVGFATLRMLTLDRRRSQFELETPGG
jgi:hypothetical protein